MVPQKPHKSTLKEQMGARLLLHPAAELTTVIPRFSKLALVANLFSNTLHAVTCAEGTTLPFQNFINSLSLSPARPPLDEDTQI